MKLIGKNTTALIGTLLCVIVIFGSCKKDDEDITPPGKLTVNEIFSTHGGAKIHYSLPADNDILYVKAAYTTSVGESVFKASSIYKDTIELEGFNSTEPQAVSLYVVDRSKNESEPVNITVTPLVSHIHLVSESITIEPTFGGVNLSWENVVGKMVHVKLLFKSVYGLDSILFSRDNRYYSTQIKGMDSVNYSISCIVEDKYENKTPERFIIDAKPQFEEKIDKSTWSLVTSLSANGNEWEGLTVNFWDDVIDTKEDPSDNSYFIMNKGSNGGALNYPLDIVIDLNKKALVNRLAVWQRDFWYPGNNDNTSDESYYYQPENMRMFDIYTSNDLEIWVYHGSFDIGDPKDEDGNISQLDMEIARVGHEFTLDQSTEPFRYFKFSITGNYGSSDNIYGSEITLFGVDNIE